MTTPAHPDSVPLVTLAAPVPAAVDTGRRRITGLILSWADVASTSAGPTRFTRGALTWSEPRRVKLLREHDRTTPLGYAVDLAATDAGVVATFHVPAGADGDRALAEAASGLRDGLSVGAEIDAAHLADDGTTLTVTAARLREVSQVAVPAYDVARVSHVAATTPAFTRSTYREDAPVLTATTEPPATPAAPAPPAEPTPAPTNPGGPPPAPVEPTPGPGEPTEPGPGSVHAGGPPAWYPAPHTRPAPRELNLAGFATLVAATYAGRAHPGELRAALSDIVPGDAAPYFRPTYLSELWDGATATRPLIDAVTTRPLPRAMRIVAHRWTTRPAVAAYAGDKAPVPSNPVGMEDITVNVERSAGAHDVDRAFIDLGSPDYLASYFAAMTDSYRRVTEAKLAARLAADAPALTDATPDTLMDGVVAAVVELAALGETADWVALSGGLVTELLAVDAMSAPAYFGGAFSLRSPGDGTLGGLRFITTPALAANVFIVGSRSSVIWWEANPPVKVQAVDVANGGVDVGVFGYHASAVVNPNAIRRGTVTAPA